MKWTLLPGGLLFLLCDFLTVVAGAEKNFEGPATWREKIPPHALRHLAAPTTTKHNTGLSTDGPEERVQLPTQDCSNDVDCLSYSSSSDIGCINGLCWCRPPLCWVYEYYVTGAWTAKNEFTCGQCGILGSSCNATNTCDFPGECWSDGYCHCPRGENHDGVCLTSNLSWTNTLAFTAMGIVFFIATCILAVNCYRQPPWRNSEAWRCSCCKAVVSSRQRRRGSCEKTPAFTIQAHYASQDLTSPQEEVQGASTYGAGGAVPRRPRTPSTSSGTISSISSVNTNTTTVSGSVSGDSSAHTLPPRSPPPPPPPPSLSSPSDPNLPSPLIPSPSTSLLPRTSSSSAASALPHTPSSPTAPPPPYEPLPPAPSNSSNVMGHLDGDSSNMQLTEILPGASSLPPPTSKPSSEVASASSGVSGGCTHERCQLCLPKAPVSPVSAPPRRRTSERHNMNGKSPLLLRTEKSEAENAIELTQL